MNTPLWLFCGPELGERNTAINTLKQTAQKRCGELDSHLFYAGDTAAGTVLDILQNGSLFAAARFVVVRNAELWTRKEDIQAITRWATGSSQANDVFLVLVSDEISIDKKIDMLVPKNQKKICWELFENKKHEWIRRFFSQRNIRITSDGIESLLELIDNNTEALKTACTHISLFVTEDDMLDAKTLEQLLAHNKEETVFSLFDALVKNNFEYALTIYQKISLSKDNSPIQIIAGLTYCFRKLLDWHIVTQNTVADDFSLKKAGFSSKRSIEQYRRAARLWGIAATRRILALLNQTDIQLRSSGQELRSIVVESCLYGIACTQGGGLQIYTSDIQL